MVQPWVPYRLFATGLKTGCKPVPKIPEGSTSMASTNGCAHNLCDVCATVMRLQEENQTQQLFKVHESSIPPTWNVGCFGSSVGAELLGSSSRVALRHPSPISLVEREDDENITI